MPSHRVLLLLAQLVQFLPVHTFKPHPNDSLRSSQNNGKHLNARRPRHLGSLISSIYLDSSSYQLYSARLRRDEGAVALRMRVYCPPDDVEVQESSEVFIERKTHHEGDQESVKERFKLVGSGIPALLREQVVAGGVTDAMSKRERELCKEVRQLMTAYQLRPVLCTNYNRTALQLPGDDRIRISIDEELQSLPATSANGGAWDLTQWTRCLQQPPLDSGAASDSSGDKGQEFPHAVLELKLHDAEMPDWFRLLLDSPDEQVETARFSQ